MKALQQNLTKLEGADTQVLGVSMDSPFSNFAFAQQNGISFPILGDWGGPVTSRYGLTQRFDIQCVPMETARRATFLIDKSGKIINEQVDDEAVDPTKTVEACERQKLKNSGKNLLRADAHFFIFSELGAGRCIHMAQGTLSPRQLPRKT